LPSADHSPANGSTIRPSFTERSGSSGAATVGAGRGRTTRRRTEALPAALAARFTAGSTTNGATIGVVAAATDDGVNVVVDAFERSRSAVGILDEDAEGDGEGRGIVDTDGAGAAAVVWVCICVRSSRLLTTSVHADTTIASTAAAIAYQTIFDWRCGSGGASIAVGGSTTSDCAPDARGDIGSLMRLDDDEASTMATRRS
jgi:hypothetical protein